MARFVALALLTLAALLLAGCGGQTSTASDPTSCLKAEGLSNVEARGDLTWRGFHQDPFYGIDVHEWPSPAEAAEFVADATEAVTAQAGSYVVGGPAPGAPDARDVVDAVAHCLD